MIAAQTVLGLIEPQSSGLGGGAFVVYHDAKHDEPTTFDAREKAPAAAIGTRFLDENGDSIGFINAWQSGLSVDVPGVPRLKSLDHDSMIERVLERSAHRASMADSPGVLVTRCEPISFPTCSRTLPRPTTSIWPPARQRPQLTKDSTVHR